MSDFDNQVNSANTDIAIVGMAAQLPGAAGIDAYWENLKNGVSAIRRLSDDELVSAGVDPADFKRADYVPYAAPMDGFDLFDADFFGFGPKEAAIMDPQHRKFLEVSWQALENAGHMPENFDGPIGVFAGCGMGSYFYFNICSNRDLVDSTGMFLLRHTGNDKDFLSTRLSHILDLKGPSISVQTACSTSLVAVHTASQALLNGECDMAVAGGVTIELPHAQGYTYKDGEILSPDGACHAFDHRAQGTVFGSGAGVLILRRLSDAIADRDNIWAVIKGSAINNDGSDKAGYLAPSVGGQAAAIADAQALAGVTADTVDYVECHGTGTYLGDPIEVAALTEAFHETTQETEFCRIGSVKTNIGHLDTAAGSASLIKTALSLHHKQIPPSLGFEAPNPAIDFASSPFTVNAALTDWTPRKGPRRAGVNSLGVGGTNAHVIVDEAPVRAGSDQSDWPFHILTLSARNKAALEEATSNLAAHLAAHPDQPLADVAWTLKQGRRAFDLRRVVVAETHAQATEALQRCDPREVYTHKLQGASPETVFMFPGGGAQYAGMARDLYETEPVFAEWVDAGLAILEPKLDYDIRDVWLPEIADKSAADERLKTPSVQLPLIMIVEYALAQLLMSWGVRPAVLVGHSMGENTAACVAGVMSFEDCIGLVHLRGKLFDTVPAGGMLSVNLPADALRGYLGEDLDLAAVNGPNLSVASGSQSALDSLSNKLHEQDIECQRVAIDIAAHSRMLEPILAQFGSYLRSIELHAPQLPILSNKDGAVLSAAQATDPQYWVEHLRGTVNFAACIENAAQTKGRVFLEVGPGKALSSLTQQNAEISPDQVINVLRHPEQTVPDDAFFLGVLGRLWAVGVDFDWEQIWGDAVRNKVVLPNYPFQQSRYFIERVESTAAAVASTRLMRDGSLDDWTYDFAWTPEYAACDLDIEHGEMGTPKTWLVFVDDSGIAMPIVEKLRAGGHDVIEVRPGDSFAQVGDHSFILSPEHGRDGYDQLLQTLIASGKAPERIAHFWTVTQSETFRAGSSFFHRTQEQGFYSLTFLAQAISIEALPTPVHINVISNGALGLNNERLSAPGKATLAGPVQVIPNEFPNVTVGWLDVTLAEPAKKTGWFSRKSGRDAEQETNLENDLLSELLSDPRNGVSVLRNGKRYTRSVRNRSIETGSAAAGIRDGGCYLITGGFGGIGLTIAQDLAQSHGAKIVLMSRQALPDNPSDDDPSSAQRRLALDSLREAGAEVMCLQGDVSNLQDMQRVRDEVEAVFGPVHGVIHAAGVIADAPILNKSPASIEAVFTPKIHGTQVIEQVFPDGSLDWLALFSSSSTVTAPAGQLDYVAANAYLNAYAQSRLGDQTKVFSLNWGIWSDVGMAAEARADRLGEAKPMPVKTLNGPLLDTGTYDANGRILLGASLTVDEHWVLDQHRTKTGTILLPGTAYFQLCSEALAAQGVQNGYEIRDLYFLRPFDVSEHGARDLRMALTASDAGFDLSVQSPISRGARSGYIAHAQASIALGSIKVAPPVDLRALAARLPAPVVAEPQSYLPAPQEVHLDFGPRWHVLQSMALGEAEGLAELRLPESASADLPQGYALHPALMDIATGWAMGLINGYKAAHLWVPLSYGAVRIFGDMPSRVFSWVRNHSINSSATGVARFDVTICDADGIVIAEIDDFSIKRLDEASSMAHAPIPRDNEIEFSEGPASGQPLSEAEERLHHNISQGLKPAEGAAAFMRALTANTSRMIVSTLDLNALKQQSQLSIVDASGAGPGFERPDLDSDYVEPETDVERTLAGYWEDLLGVQQVGIDDSFFDLGGHSLIAVRLFAMIKKAYRTEFPISVLFEAPTIRTCAALIEAQIGPVDASTEAGSQMAQTAPARRFTHIVPMHEGAAGDRQPFFLVAGMFGNVLNLRHLAHLLGENRPFYGLQARGLYGDEAPHSRIEDAARDYIVEMRQVQPVGPYMLGGFSGGGITAYEIRKQLEAAGETVLLLVLLDTPLPVRRPLKAIDRLHIQKHEILSGGIGYFGRWAVNRVKWEISKRRSQDISNASTEHAFHNAEIEAAFLEAVGNYKVEAWAGNIQLFRPPLVGHWTVSDGALVNSERAYVLSDNDWSQFTPQIEVTEVPGDHDSMVLEPNVRVLAAHMRDVIEQAEAGNIQTQSNSLAAE